MEIRYSDGSPSVDPDAHVAPTAVLGGQVRVGLNEAGGFLPLVSGSDPADDRSQQMPAATRRYARFPARTHQHDEPVS